MDFKCVPVSTSEEKLQALIHLSVTYMRKLRINSNGKDIRNLPHNHELSPYFEKIKKKNKGHEKIFTSHRLMESCRTEKGPRQRTVLNLGRLEISEEQFKTE